jgi:hypothetical protein
MRITPYHHSRQVWLDIITAKGGVLYVNSKYGPQLKDHASLRKLIRKGVLKVRRSGDWSTKRTCLQLTSLTGCTETAS